MNFSFGMVLWLMAGGWKLLHYVTNDVDLQTCVKKTLSQLVASGVLDHKRLLKALQTAIDHSNTDTTHGPSIIQR